MKFTCPYCNKKGVPPPVKGERYQTCSLCGKKPRVAIVVQNDGKILIKYVSTARPKKDPLDIRRSRGLKTSDRERAIMQKRGFQTEQQFFDYCLSLDIRR